LTLVAGTREIEVQAQSDAIRVQARAGLRGASGQAHVELAAGKTLHVATAGGASITVADGNIVVNAPGAITVHAQRKSFLGPSSTKSELPSWVLGDMKQKRIIGFSG